MGLGNMKIGIRLGFGFLVMLLIIAIVSGAGFTSLKKVNDEVSASVDGPVKKKGVANEWILAVSVNVSNTIALLRSDEGVDRAYFSDETDKQGPVIQEILKKANAYVSEDPEEVRLYKRILDMRLKYIDVRNKMIAIQKAGDKTALAEGVGKEFMPIVTEYLQTIRDINTFYDNQVMQAATTVESSYKFSTMMISIVTLVGIILGIVISFILTKGITVPLKSAVDLAEMVANGHLSQHDDVVIRRKDEIGQLLLSLKRMRENLFNTVSKIRAGSESISTSATQVATGNLDLSSRTEEQASSLEETASSMEELTSTVKQNADNASQAHMLSSQATTSAVKGQEVITQVVATMQDITASSQKMEDIINVIDGIAFQTNILALNAAVEAARAGEQGRGFAVVATEVRNLAQRSASAAKEIKALIDTSVAQVKQGSRLAADAGNVMTEIAQGAQRSTDVIAEISAASKEQSAGIEQVSEAVMQLDQVTQQNAALVEQSAAASESMRDQAQKLVEAVSIFVLSANDMAIAVAQNHQQAKMLKDIAPDNLLSVR